MIRSCLVALMVLATPALAQAKDRPMHHAKAAETPATKAYEVAMDRMMADMHVKPTGDADKDFVSMMLPHHKGAVAMAKVELEYGTDPMLRKMAQDIVDSQTKEIGEMEAWQAAHK